MTIGLHLSPTATLFFFIDNFFPLLIFAQLLFSDTSGTVRRVGGNFKECLRDHGGLDAVFDVIVSCHSIMKVSWY